MISTTPEIRNAIEERHEITAKVIAMLNDSAENPTTLTIEADRLMAGGITLNDGTSSSGSFDIGAAIINQCTIQLDNSDGRYSDYNFEEATATVYAGIVTDDEGTVEWMKKGTYILSDPTTTPAVITLKGVDYMAKFDRAYDGNMSFPRTVGYIVQYCCSSCGVTLGTDTFTNSDYLVNADPFEGDVTYRQIIAWCAQIACCFARCNKDGQLEMRWYDKTAFQQGNETRRHSVTKFSQGPIVNTEDVVITGVRVTAKEAADGTDGESSLYGNEGYVLEITDNPLIAYGQAEDTAELIGAVVNNMRFRPGTASIVGDPAMEAGDAVLLTDRKGNQYQSYITNLTYVIGNFSSISCDAVPALRKSADRYSSLSATAAKIRKEVVRGIDTYVQAQIALDTLAVNALGFYESYETDQNGGVIKYAHNAPTRAQSTVIYKQTADGFFLARRQSTSDAISYSNGFNSSGNAVLSMIAAIGINASWIEAGTLTVGGPSGGGTVQITVRNQSDAVIGTWDSSGIRAVNADITGKITSADGEIGGWKITSQSIRKEVANAETSILLSNNFDATTVFAIGAPWHVLPPGGEVPVGDETVYSDAPLWGSAPFRVTKTGKLISSDADITGKISSGTGDIGGWKITSQSIRKEVENAATSILLSNNFNGTTVFAIGATWYPPPSNSDGEEEIPDEEEDDIEYSDAPLWGSAPFRVTKAGKLFATGAEIKGTVISQDEYQRIVLDHGILTGFEKHNSNSWSQASFIDMAALYDDSIGGCRNIAIKGGYGAYLQAGNRITLQIGNSYKAVITSTGISVDTRLNINGGVKVDGQSTYTGWIWAVTGLYSDKTIYSARELYVRNGIICTA